MSDNEKALPLSPMQKDIFSILKLYFKRQSTHILPISRIDESQFSKKINRVKLKDCLISYGFNVPFDVNIIVSIKQRIFETIQPINDETFYQFFLQCFAYIVTNEKNKDGTTKLLSIFSKLLPQETQQSKVITFFTIVLKEYSEQNTITDQDYNSIQFFLDFFLENQKQLPESFSEAFFAYISLNERANLKITAVSDLFKKIEEFRRLGILFFSITDNEYFFNILKPYVYNLHTQGLKLLHEIASSNDDYNENINSIYLTMAKGFNEKITQSDSYDEKSYFIKQTLTEIPNVNELGQIKYDTIFKKIPDFEYKESEVPPLFSYSDNFTISSDFAPELIQNYLEKASNAIGGVRYEYINTLIHQIINDATKDDNLPFYSDFFSIVIFFANQIQFFDDEIIQFLISPIVFHSSKFSSFNVDIESNPNYYYYYLRHSVFILMMKHGNPTNKLVENLLIFCAKMSPFIYSEIILYVLKNLDSFKKLDIFCTKELLMSLMYVSIQLQDIYSNLETENDDSCRLARIICFDFIFKLFNDPGSFSMIISDREFSNGLSNFILEQSLSNLIISQFMNAFSNYKVDLKNPPFCAIISVFKDILISCTSNKNDNRYKELGINITKSIFESARKNHDLIYFLYWIFNYVLIFSKEAQINSIIDDIFDFYLLVLVHTNLHDMKNDTLNIFADLVIHLLDSNNELIEKFQLLFLTLLAGKEIKSTDQNFVINYSQIIPLFILSFSKYPNLDKILSIFNALCQYSPTNRVACHDGKLDYFLVFFLQKKSEFPFNSKDVSFAFDIQQSYQLILEIFTRIIQSKTSNYICDQFIQMLIPSSPSYQINNVKTNLELIYNIVNENIEKPKPILSLITNQTLCNIKGFTDIHVNNDFTFSFGLKVDIPQLLEIQDDFILALIQDSVGTEYIFSIKTNDKIAYINIKVKNANSEQKKIQKKRELPSDKQVIISFVHQQDDPKFLMFYINESLVDRISTSSFQFNPGEVSITLGTSTSSSAKKANKKIGEIINFCFSNEAKPKLNSNSNIYLSSDKILNPQIQNEFDIINPTNFQDESSLNNVLIDYDLNHLTNVYSKFTVNDSNLILTFLKIILSLLSSASQSIQRNYKSVVNLGRTIIKLFDQSLNYKIYLELFEAFKNLKDREISECFFSTIIFNMNIWCLADENSIIDIIKHLITSSKGEYESYFINACSVSRLFTIYKLSFMTKEGEIDGYKESAIYPFKKYHTEEELESIKKEFFGFIVERAKSSLNCEDLKTVYYHLLDSHHKIEKIDLLIFISIMKEKIFTIKKENSMSIDFDLVSPLFTLFSLNDIDIIVHSLLTIKAMSSENANLYFTIISLFLIDLPNIKDVYSGILAASYNDFNLFSVVCSLALLMNEKPFISAGNLLEKISLNENRNKITLDGYFLWSVWPICIALAGSKSQRNQVASFLVSQITRKTIINNLIPNYVNIHILIGYLNQNDNLPAILLQSEFTSQLLKFVFDKNNSDINIDRCRFLIVAFISIFIHQTPSYRNFQIQNHFIQSEFSSDQFYNIDKNNQNKNYRKNFNDIYYSANNQNDEENENQVNLSEKSAKDYSGKRTILLSNLTKYKTTSCEKFKFTDDDFDGEKKSNKKKIDFIKPYKSINQLLEFERPVKLKNIKLTFQLRFDNENETQNNFSSHWIDFNLCQNLCEYSKIISRQIIQNSYEFKLLSSFISVCEYFKKRIQNQTILNSHLELDAKIQEIFNLISKNKCFMFESIDILELLKKAFDMIIAIIHDDNNELVDHAHLEYINNFKNEIIIVNKFRGPSFDKNDGDDN